MKLARTIRDLWKFLGPLGLARVLLLLLFGLVSLIPGMRMWLIKHVFLRGILVDRKAQGRIDE